MWLSATVRLADPPDARQLRDQRIARSREGLATELPLAISSIKTSRGRPAALPRVPLPPQMMPRIQRSNPGFATSRTHPVLAPMMPQYSPPRTYVRTSQSAREYARDLPSPRRGLHVGDLHVLRTKPKTVTEWRDRRSRLHPQKCDLPGVGVASRREKRRYESTQGVQNAARDAEQVAAELRELLAAHAPDRLTYVPSLLTKWEGREQELLASMRRRYRLGIDRLEAESHERRCRELVDAAKQAYDEGIARDEQISAEAERQLEAGAASSVRGLQDVKQRLTDLRRKYEQRTAELAQAVRRREETAALYEDRQARQLAKQQAEQLQQQGGTDASSGMGDPAAADEDGDRVLASESMSSIASSNSSIFDALATPRSRPLPESSQRPHRGLMARLDRSSWLKNDF